MTYWLSSPFEDLLHDFNSSSNINNNRNNCLYFDSLIIGSGYGAAMSALALAENNESQNIVVFEKGLEFIPDDFPKTIGEIPGHLSFKLKDKYSKQTHPRTNTNITLQDGAIPYALKNIWNEIIVSQSFLKRFVTDTRSAWHNKKEKQNSNFDPLSVSNDLGKHSQVILVMGHDEANGEIIVNLNGSATPNWPAIENENNYYQLLHEVFSSEKVASGFDGGEYHPNIFWKPIPDGFKNFLEGFDKISKQIITVHPLGGDCMGNNALEGVVNFKGQVFKGNTGENVYDSLYVLDGSIIPRPIGTNPFMTIATLSYALACQIEPNKEIKKEFPNPNYFNNSETEIDSSCNEIPKLGPYNYPSSNENNVTAIFSERLGCDFANHNSSEQSVRKKNTRAQFNSKRLLRHDLFRHLDIDISNANLIKANFENAKSFVVDVKIYFGQANEQSLNCIPRWLEKPNMTLKAEAILYLDLVGSLHTWPNKHLYKIGQLPGTVNLGQIDKARGFKKTLRAMQVLFKFLILRPYHLPDLLFQDFKNILTKDSSSIISIIEKLSGFWRVAKLHTDWRIMNYEFKSSSSILNQASISNSKNIKLPPIKLSGQKILKMNSSADNLWDSLLTLPIILERIDNNSRIKLNLSVDPIRISNVPSPLQITKSLHTPNSIFAVAGMGSYFLRVFLQTYFWSFGAAKYTSFKNKSDLENKNNKLSRLYLPPDIIEYKSENTTLFSRPIETYHTQVGPCRLIRYQPDFEDNNRPVILLIHGLAHSSRVFWTDSIDTNFVQYFLKNNFDVWLVDHRTSANLVDKVNPNDTWDNIALIDLPWAVKTIFNHINKFKNTSNKKQIHVFAHCIGAGAISIAALNGELNQKDKNGNPIIESGSDSLSHQHSDSKHTIYRSMLASLSLHAVSPWFYASSENRSRANLWTFFKDLNIIKIIKPLVHKHSDLIENIYDRLATSTIKHNEIKEWGFFNNLFDRRGPGYPRTIYKRYTIFWGQQWHYKNICSKTKKEFAGMIGPTPTNVVRQILFSIQQKQLTNNEGENSYINSNNLFSNWTFPTLFTHGTKNQLFDVESARLSGEMLSNFRSEYNNSIANSNLSDTEHIDRYLKNNVWVEIFEDYGHMDVIFGKNIGVDICPKIKKFINSVNRNNLIEAYKYEYSNFNEFSNKCHARTNIRPDDFPITGPIISHPNSSKSYLRVWLEANDKTIMAPYKIQIKVLALENTNYKCFDIKIPKTEYNTKNNNCGQFYIKDLNVKSLCGTSVSLNTLDALFKNREHLISAYHISSEHIITQKKTMFSKLSNPNFLDAEFKGILFWPVLPWFQRTYNYPQTKRKLSFVIGSCRQQGTIFEHDLSDKIFRGIWLHILGPDLFKIKLRGIDHVLFLGDQIYADATANIFDPSVIYEKYRLKYRKAFCSKYAKHVMANVPTYFVIDDHEIENNWSGGCYDGLNQPDKYKKCVDTWKAFNEAYLYQMHHDCAMGIKTKNKYSSYEQANHPNNGFKFWYDFISVERPFFVFDSRSQRNRPDSIPYGSLINQKQFTDFKNWLAYHNDKHSTSVLFIASGSPISPIERDLEKFPSIALSGDSLLAYPGFISRTIKYLHQFAMNKSIIWLTGDPHLSSFAKLQCSYHESITGKTYSAYIYNICASGLFSPYPFANEDARKFEWMQSKFKKTSFQQNLIKLKTEDGFIKIKYSQELLSDNIQHFIRVELNKEDTILQLSAHGINGETLMDPKEIQLNQL